ncbi:MAG: aminotransferase class V-fold PLP-dependent enzyme [Gemmataceae bacterium]
MKPLSDRRAFLIQAGVASLATARAAAFTPVLGEDYWLEVRRRFPFTEKKVPLNAANLCPSPRAVSDRVTALTRDIDVDCSFQNRAKFEGLLETSRQAVARQLAVHADEIALVRNTSEANNIINNGLALKPGAEIVLWDQNHPTNNVAWEVRAARFGYTLKRVATPAQPATVDDLIEPFRKALSPKTRVLALTHVSNVSGVRLPIKELVELAHKQEIFVHVDGAQTWGAFALNLRELGCDSFTGSAHKWLCGPKEVGLLYVKQERIGAVWPGVVAPGWGDQVAPAVKGARKFESLGQRDDAALAAIATAVEMQSEIGGPRIETRIFELIACLKAGLTQLGIEMVTPAEPKLSGGVCIIAVPAAVRQRVFKAMYDEHGIAAAATGGLRLCPHMYNTMEHIERAVGGVKALRKLWS